MWGDCIEKSKVAAYVRISREDNNKKENINSYSIDNQIEYIYRYAIKNNIIVDKVYIDDGLSGMTFERPGFFRLLSDIKSGMVKCVITKDISRLGRNYIETNYYIFNVFQKYNVKYIAINDYIEDKENMDLFFMLKTVVNHKYVEDISNKIKAITNMKKRNLEYIGSIAPFGYIKEKVNGKVMLSIDKECQSIIKVIFIMVASGVKLDRIIYILNKSKIPTPSEYLRLKNKYSIWNRGMIYRIIRNRVYIGILEERKSQSVNLMDKKRKYIPLKQRVQKENAFPKIVNDLTFYFANNNIGARKEGVPSRRLEKFYCLKCGKRLREFERKRKSGKNYVYYYCSKCKNKISKNVLYSILYNIYQSIIDKKYFENSERNLIKHVKDKAGLTKIDAMLKNVNMLNLYINNRLSMEKYGNMVYNKKYCTFDIHNLKNKLLKDTDFFILNFVDKIYIYKKIEIHFNFAI